LRSKDQGWQNVPEQRRGNGAKRNDLAVVEAEPPTGGEAHKGLLCEVFFTPTTRPPCAMDGAWRYNNFFTLLVFIQLLFYKYQ
jgi:hypothetical protein